MKEIFQYIIIITLIFSSPQFYQISYANPFFSNGYFTENGIEWCQENFPLYEFLGDKFFEHHKHSLESRVCASLYNDYLWDYTGSDRSEKLIEKSKFYSQLEILESLEESKTGIIDTTPAGIKDHTLQRGTTENGEIIVQIISSKPNVNQPMEINLSFLGQNNSLISNVHFGIIVKQQDKTILENQKIFSENGLSTIVSRPLNSEEPVIIEISVNGIGMDGDLKELDGPKGEVIIFTVVPEFGSIVMMMLVLVFFVIIFLTQINKKMIFELKK